MNTMTIEGQVMLSGEHAANVIRQLNDRVEALERQLRLVRQDAAEQGSTRLADVIRYLRMHSVVLLYTGQGRAEDLADQIKDEVAAAALQQAWSLDNAPLPLSVIAQVRAATIGGMNRF